ncbi:acyltransferase [Corallincola holothuriorum]|uniref:Acyltransferase n=1 Tax=Corallincola holothuriorum TaxID=2282215 RepID=A0A368NNJ3_9GAMM|nr:acyltransferase family protein [Corallincola holothuriorum]RCU51670.1 acyltransferase [Corallincola holothuriorum]
MQFRKDINGLRAIAVIAVVLFHFDESWMPGGFAGVDVFFVISGFLMTGIIFRGIEKDSFSILKFYVSRANRIIPALAVLCLVLLVFGWFYLTPLDYKELGKHVGSSMGFLSNITYWRESGYFDAASHEKWLLHTWSLSAEWQFYMIYPLVLVAMRKFMSLKVMKVTVLIATALGVLFCIVATYKWPDPAYYLLPTRAWEMMLGGVAYLYPLKLENNRKKLFEWLGLALIVLSYILISKENLWPGYLALFPVFGAFLIIQAQRDDSVVTGNIIFQKLGKWSYSIYLWHWPLVVAIYYFSLNEIFIYLGVLLSVFIGFISSKYIENIKFRNDFGSPVQYLKCKPIYFFVFTGLLGGGTFLTNGFAWHYNSSVTVSSLGQMDINFRRNECLAGYGEESRQCEYGTGEVGAIVIGDSHAQSLVPNIASMIPNKTLDWTLSSCRTIKGIFYIKNGIRYDSCGDWLEKAFRKIPPNTPIVVHNWLNVIFDSENPNEYTEQSFNGSRDEYKKMMGESYINTICELSRDNPVIIVKDTPVFDFSVPKEMAKNSLFRDEGGRVFISIEEYRRQNELTEEIYKSVAESCDRVVFVDPKEVLCSNDKCYGDYNGKPLYFDSNHLSTEGANRLALIIEKALISY